MALAGATTLTVTGSLTADLRLGLLLLAVGLPTLLVEGVVGRSPGKVGLGLRHAPPDASGPALSLPQAVGRFVLKWMLPVVLVAVGLWLAAGVLWVALYLPALGPSGRGLHDRLTRTRVLGPSRDAQQRADV